jgi:hypothetical protein
MNTVKVTKLPYKAPIKRRQEALRFCVVWTNYTSGVKEFRWYRRDTAAVNFLNRQIDAGFDAHISMK